MATGSFVLSNVLCFLITKLRNNGEKLIKTALLDFFDAPVLNDAKRQLKSDIESLELPDDIAMPHVPERREGETRAVRIVDDLITLYKFADTNLLFKILPTYVIDNPDNVPSTRIYEGDLATLVTIIGKLEDKLTGHDKALAAITGDIRTLQATVQQATNLVDYMNRRIDSVVTDQNVIRQQLYTLHQRQPNRPGPGPGPSAMFTTGVTAATSSASSRPQGAPLTNSSQAERVQNVNKDTPAATSSQQMSASSAKPLSTTAPMTAMNNRFSVLQSTTDFESDDNRDNPFIEVTSRRSRRVRRRQNSSDTHPRGTAAAPPSSSAQAQGGVETSQRRGTRILVGTRQQPSTNTAIVAAKPLPTPVQKRKRRVLYVDNLSKDCEPEALTEYVESLSVEVFSCYKAVPRRKPGASPDKSRAAFRLCVALDDAERVLDPSAWPQDIVVSEWVHKQPTDQSQKRSRIDNELTVAIVHREPTPPTVSDMDTITILSPPPPPAPAAAVDNDDTLTNENNV